MERRESSGEVAKRGFALYCGVTLLVDFCFFLLFIPFLRNGLAFCLSLIIGTVN